MSSQYLQSDESCIIDCRRLLALGARSFCWWVWLCCCSDEYRSGWRLPVLYICWGWWRGLPLYGDSKELHSRMHELLSHIEPYLIRFDSLRGRSVFRHLYFQLTSNRKKLLHHCYHNIKRGKSWWGGLAKYDVFRPVVCSAMLES